MGPISLSLISECLSNVSDPVLVLDQQLECVYANGRFFVALGHDASATPLGLLKRSEFWPEATVGLIDKHVQSEEPFELKLRCADQQVRVCEACVKRLDGRFFLIQFDASAIGISDGLHAERLETLGMLSGGIAHDINNILTGILGHASYLMAVLGGQKTHGESLKAIEDGAKKAAMMTRQIVDFSKNKLGEGEQTIDLAVLVESACNLLRGAISRQYTISFELPPNRVLVKGVEGQLSQVLINLVVNARDALQGTSGAEIKIKVGVEELGEDPVFVGLSAAHLKSKSCAVLSVTDNGAGIPEELHERMFTPYFSTKKEKGSGIGLATARKIIQAHHGAIDVHSELNKGTSISIFLPLLDSEQQTTPEVSSKSAMIGGSERILIVDDEEHVSSVLAMGLERLGYYVEVASSGKQAIDKYSAEGAKFDLVILDMIMPDISGREVFMRLKQFDPEVSVLISSAFSSEEAIRSILDRGGKGFIQKPFDMETLASRVRRALDE